jgi:curved DNA-binding protein CbpA
MSAATDLYDELGVDRDADEQTIRRAFRRRAKETHPDAGGSAEAFAATSTALAVLTDPKRRKQYDRTGDADAAEPDNQRAHAIGVVHRFFDEIATPWFASCAMDDTKDPRGRDVVGDIQKAIKRELAAIKRTLPNGERVVAAYEEMAARFESRGADNFLRRHLEAGARENRLELERVKEGVEVHQLALELLAEIKFRRDAPASYSFLAGPVQLFDA